MDRKPVAALATLVFCLLAGCSTPTPPQITIANRSDAVLTVGPGLVIPACSSIATTQADYMSALTKANELVASGHTWDAPAGALVWDMPIVSPAGTVPIGPITIIVSSTAEVDARRGTVAEDALPACGGQPLIEPGVPQGGEPVYTTEPASP